jgi:large subunit ribosomal protein L24
MQDIRKNDTVQVMTGDDKGKKGRVLRINREDKRILIEGVNYIWRHVKPSQKNPQGGRVQKEASIAISNVMLVCPECETGRSTTYHGQKRAKARVCRKCGHEIPAVK